MRPAVVIWPLVTEQTLILIGLDSVVEIWISVMALECSCRRRMTFADKLRML